MRTATSTSPRPEVSEAAARRFFAALLLGLGLGRSEAATTRPADLVCRLEAQPTYRAGGPVEVGFTLSNRANATVRVLRWYTPLEGVRGDIFRVSRAGRRLRYDGPLMKRGDPGPADYVEVPPGKSVTATADLSGAYGIQEPGTYRVAFTRGLADVARSGDTVPRPRDRHRAMKLACPPIELEVTAE